MRVMAFITGVMGVLVIGVVGIQRLWNDPSLHSLEGQVIGFGMFIIALVIGYNEP
jgi:hypothetical protein